MSLPQSEDILATDDLTPNPTDLPPPPSSPPQPVTDYQAGRFSCIELPSSDDPLAGPSTHYNILQRPQPEANEQRNTNSILPPYQKESVEELLLQGWEKGEQTAQERYDIQQSRGQTAFGRFGLSKEAFRAPAAIGMHQTRSFSPAKRHQQRPPMDNNDSNEDAVMGMLARFAKSNRDLTKQVQTLTNTIATLTSTTMRNYTDILRRMDGSRAELGKPTQLRQWGLLFIYL